MEPRSRAKPKQILAAVGTVAVLFAGTQSTANAAWPATSDPTKTPFCEPTEPVNDFGLSTLPPTREGPVDGDLPFGPKTVSMSVDAGPVIAVGGGVRFDVSSINYYGRTPLEWVMRDRLRTVDETSNIGAVISRGKRRIRFINAAREDKLILYPPKVAGFYRYEVEISDFDGERLARYAYNLRVERKFWDVRLGLNRTVFHPGNHVLSRIENFGTLAPFYGEEFHLQRLTGGTWRTIRIPGRGGWLLWAGSASPGMSGRCSSLALPRDFAPGQYRIVKEWERRLTRDAPTYHLAARFEVHCGSRDDPCPALPEPRIGEPSKGASQRRKGGFWRTAPGPRLRTIVIFAEAGWAPKIGKTGSPIDKPRMAALRSPNVGTGSSLRPTSTTRPRPRTAPAPASRCRSTASFQSDTASAAARSTTAPSRPRYVAGPSVTSVSCDSRSSGPFGAYGSRGPHRPSPTQTRYLRPLTPLPLLRNMWSL